jgi:hypothetical protein
LGHLRDVSWFIGFFFDSATKLRSASYARQEGTEVRGQEGTEVRGRRSEDGTAGWRAFLPDSLYMRIFYNFSILCQKR